MFRATVDMKDMGSLQEAQRAAEEMISRVPGGATCVVERIDSAGRVLMRTQIIKPKPVWTTSDDEATTRSSDDHLD